MAYEHLQSSLTRGNLWLYILSELRTGDATPGQLRSRVLGKQGFAPAAITFYSVIYKLNREGLVKKSSASFRSAYSITPQGKESLFKAMSYLDEVRKRLADG